MGSGIDSFRCDLCGDYRCNCNTEENRDRDRRRLESKAKEAAENAILKKYRKEIDELAKSILESLE